MPVANSDKIRSVRNLQQLLDYLRDELDWPIEDYGLDELTFDWQANKLNLSEPGARHLAGGAVRQLRPFRTGQPWGIFIVEFTDDAVHRGSLREILRGLVANRRRDPALPAWQHDNLLFVCLTQNCERITFAHYRGAKAQKARLATFGWQSGSTYVRTLCEFNLPALAWPEDPGNAEAWLKQWASAFDKEPITKEFFKRFDDVLEAIQADLQKFQDYSSAEAYSRAQLLLERVIFLYFLQNRGWLDRQRTFLLDHFAAHREKPKACSYYEDFLLPLFWTLASPPGSQARLPGVPYLNGGLFDDDEFNPQPASRKINPPLQVRNATFAFVFEHLLEAFNFTVREDTPLNQDVAVDPEMLGKVFESIVLHAESNANYNAPDKRKATGSYYTPRIVVHFICREALRQYLRGHLGPDWEDKLQAVFAVDASDGLDADEIALLKSSLKPADGQRLLEMVAPIKMCDPAVGSGAFPVGLLHELVNLRRIAVTVAKGYTDPARKEGSNWIHEAKADIVENCLYGADIQQQAIEICRLRLWLSLIVDYDLGLDPFLAERSQFQQAISNISQLPNLEMNFRRGDSLLDLISDVPIRIETNSTYEKDYEKIHKLGLDLHKAKKSERKRNLRLEILRQRLELSSRVLSDQRNKLKDEDSTIGMTLFGETKSEAESRRRIATEIERLDEALSKIQADRKAVEKIASRPMDAKFYPELRKLEGAEFDAPFNFAWRLDYADIFSPRADGLAVTLKGEFGFVNEVQKQQELVARRKQPGGFDLILGNPPFVTARNPVKRELYRERWKRVCAGKYLLVCPFFDLSFNLLRPGGQLGFIVSNAFAKREFGKPLIEDFFPTVDVQKIIDCSGLMFPGHGTPTCIVFGRNLKPNPKSPIRITATLPGGGDLRTPPEESPLWQAIAGHQDNPGYADSRITVADRPRGEMAKWPWNIDFTGAETKIAIESNGASVLRDFLAADIGFDAISAANDIYYLSGDVFRRMAIESCYAKPLLVGEYLRNYEPDLSAYTVWPYSGKNALPKLDKNLSCYLKPFRSFLEKRSQFRKTQLEAGLEWYEFREYHRRALRPQLTYADVSTHLHVVQTSGDCVFNQHAPVIELPANSDDGQLSLAGSLLNSSATLFWLKQVCFNKGAGDDEEKDRFEFAGGKIEQLPIPNMIAEGFGGKQSIPIKSLCALSLACIKRGQQMPALALRKLFEKDGESYHAWNSALPGYVAPDNRLGKHFKTAEDFKLAFSNACRIREGLRAEMIALQEEMDWLVYEAYGLLPKDNPCVILEGEVPSLAREQRPFVLWQQADGDFERAASLIPSDWPKKRKALWRARLEAIRDNEHIRRIEAPVYKRRWDEQWKVGNGWQCGPVAYDAELADAFDGWLSEKAEYWLENRKGGRPASIDEWTAALAADSRVQAAWSVVGEALVRLGRRADFDRYFSALVKEQSVPENIPFAVPWDKLPNSLAVPASAVRIRGKLNVPRERFRTKPDGTYIWAGS